MASSKQSRENSRENTYGVVQNPERHFESYLQLGLAVAYYRKLKGFSQEQFAEILGISRQHLAAIEAPNVFRKPSLDLVYDIAAALELQPYQLFKLGTE